MKTDLTRRGFMKMIGVVGAAATGCGELPGRQIMPYVIPDENVIPGMPAFYATMCRECDAGCGVVARVREGRVVKLEGNPHDPISGGALCARGHAALQELYNPDRLPEPRQRLADGRTLGIGWDDAFALLGRRLADAAAAGPARVAFVGPGGGPTLGRLLDAWLAAWRSDRRLADPTPEDDAARAATERCFGRRDHPVLRIDAAEVVVSLGAEPLETWRSPVEYTRQYAAFRVPQRADGKRIGRLVYVGPRFGLTAANGDEWIAARPGTEAAVGAAILRAMLDGGFAPRGVDRGALERFTAAHAPDAVAAGAGVSADAIRRTAAALAAADGALVVAGTADPDAHVVAHVLNAATGSVGRTVHFPEGATEPGAPPDPRAVLTAMRNRSVDVVVVAGANPAFTLSPELEAAAALRSVPFVVWCGTVPDETAAFAHLLLPLHHTLECWDDAAPRPGVSLLAQPVMQPVYASRALGDVLLASARAAGTTLPWATAAEAVGDGWRAMHAARRDGATFDRFWEDARRAGGFFEEPAVADVRLRSDALATPLRPPPAAPAPDALTLVAFPHLLLGDGRGADKPWLQEIPEPVTQVCWTDVALVHPDTARALGVDDGGVLELRSPHGVLATPARVTGHVRPGVVAMAFGQGHTAYGRYASRRGANPWALLPAGARSVAVEARATGDVRRIASPQYGLDDTLGRPLAEAVSADELREGRLHHPGEEPPPGPYELRPAHVYPAHQWGMTIDLAACTGCSACVAACYAENNVPVVGETNVLRGQVMSWIRIERFRPPADDATPLQLLPMLCQHCDHAPCEPVCPVYASVHSDEGLNAQVYNRCIGTRYCNNNCPYKVRRFNWFAPDWPAPLHLQLNPDVTVRGAGVMEKCTFCIQRIRLAEENARADGRPVADGEIQTACQQACPARAITFGDMKNAGSAVMQRRAAHPLRRYRALEDLNTEPAIVYLREVYHRREPA